MKWLYWAEITVHNGNDEWIIQFNEIVIIKNPFSSRFSLFLATSFQISFHCGSNFVKNSLCELFRQKKRRDLMKRRRFVEKIESTREICVSQQGETNFFSTRPSTRDERELFPDIFRRLKHSKNKFHVCHLVRLTGIEKFNESFVAFVLCFLLRRNSWRRNHTHQKYQKKNSKSQNLRKKISLSKARKLWNYFSYQCRHLHLPSSHSLYSTQLLLLQKLSFFIFYYFSVHFGQLTWWNHKNQLNSSWRASGSEWERRNENFICGFAFLLFAIRSSIPNSRRHSSIVCFPLLKEDFDSFKKKRDI